jgi:hypothetical protein
VTHLRFDVEMVELEYGMEFEYLFGVPDEIPDITRSSGMVRRIRFIYRKSYSKFGNDPVHLWQVLEGSRKVRKKSPWKVESRRDSTLHGQPTLKGRSPRWTPQGWPANPPRKGWESHLEWDFPLE